VLTELASELHLVDDLHFIMGKRDDIDEIVASVDIGVITSTSSEANCRVAAEWMSSGVPVVAFATGVIPEVVTDGHDGFVVPTRDDNSLAGKICLFFNMPSLHGEMSEKARNSALLRFSLEKLAKETLEVYNVVLDNDISLAEE